MVTLLLILLVGGFIQTSILPVNLVLIILICRSYLTFGLDNLWLGFVCGLLVAFLSAYPLGLLSICYLFFIALIQLVKKSNLSSNWLFILPVSAGLLTLDQMITGIFTGSSFTSIIKWPIILEGIILTIPVYLMVRFWEERFVPKLGIKLKIGK